jgi:DNA-binding beta-propeller fold protein YncE
MRSLKCLLCALCALILYPAGSAFAEVHTVIVLSQGDRTVYDMDPASGKIVNQVQLGGAPSDAVYSWDERWLFVSVPDQGYVSVINLLTFKESSRLTKPEFKRTAGPGGFVGGLATTPDGEKLYVAVADGLEVFDQHLLAYNPEYQQPSQKITLQLRDGQHMRVQGPTNKLYYPFGRENQVVVIDTDKDTVVKTLPVKGGPTDVSFFVGGEAWVASADGSVTIIDTNKDEVAKTIQTTGKGAGRIAAAWDLRYIAASHSESGDVSILQPMTKEVAGTVKAEKGPLAVAFVPAGGEEEYIGYTMKFPTNQLYITGPSEVAVADLTNMTISAHKEVGKTVVAGLIHYTYPDAFTPPREATAKRALETDVFTVFQNAQAPYDLSPIHQHRTDMVAVYTGTGINKIGCWDPECPPSVIPHGPNGVPYNYGEGMVGNYTATPRGSIHREEGVSPSPRRMIDFMPKNNYYRQMSPKKTSDFADKPGITRLNENGRAWLWNLTLVPGQPFQFPATDYAFVYLAGGLMRFTHNGVPKIVNRYFNDWEWDPTAKTVEALSNRMHIAIIEFK